MKSNGAIPGLELSSKLFWSFELNSTYDLLIRGQSLCLLDSSCKFVALQGNSCFFGDPSLQVAGTGVSLLSDYVFGNYSESLTCTP